MDKLGMDDTSGKHGSLLGTDEGGFRVINNPMGSPYLGIIMDEDLSDQEVIYRLLRQANRIKTHFISEFRGRGSDALRLSVTALKNLTEVEEILSHFGLQNLTRKSRKKIEAT